MHPIGMGEPLQLPPAVYRRHDMAWIKQFSKAGRLLFMSLALLTGCSGGLLAQDDNTILRIPATLKWDIRPANSAIEREFNGERLSKLLLLHCLQQGWGI